jgi:hypothetical protein
MPLIFYTCHPGRHWLPLVYLRGSSDFPKEPNGFLKYPIDVLRDAIEFIKDSTDLLRDMSQNLEEVDQEFQRGYMSIFLIWYVSKC